MGKGNQEIRFRADAETHIILETLQQENNLAEKSAIAKLLISLGNDRIKEAVIYIDSITHPLSDSQFDNFFLSLKIRLKQVRDEKKSVRNKVLISQSVERKTD